MWDWWLRKMELQNWRHYWGMAYLGGCGRCKGCGRKGGMADVRVCG